MYLRYGEVEGIAAIGSNRSYKKHRMSQHADFHETRLSELYLGIKKNKSIYICIYFLFQLTTCNIHALFLCSFTDKETCQPAITIDTRSKRDFINAYVLLAMVTLSMLKFLFYIFLKSHWHQRDKNPEVRKGRVFRKCLHLPHCPHTFSKRRDFQRSGNDGEGVARVCGSFSFLTLLKVYQATCTLA